MISLRTDAVPRYILCYIIGMPRRYCDLTSEGNLKLLVGIVAVK
jgi:hypothetical protein